MELKHHQKTALNYLLSISIYFILGCSISECKQRNYNGDKILRVEVSNQKEWKRVESIMQKYTAENDIWSSPATLPSFGDIRVSPEEHDIVTSQLKEFGLSFKVFIDDVQDFINAEKAESTNTTKPFRRKRATMSNQIIGTYATYEEIVEYIESAEKNFEIASIVNIGDSLEGRPLLVLKLGIPHPDPKVVKPVVWIDAAIHAREWIAPASLMYIVYQLLNGYHEKDPVIFDLLKRIDWMFLPVVNPDGFVYSHTDERLWRKNRAIVNGSTCMGVDLNRNFDFHWGEETASDDPCHVMYRGDSPASEVETRLVQNFLLENKKSIFVYISLHSYSQFWFSRWAYTEEKVATHDEMMGLAKLGVEAIKKVNNAQYRAGLSHELMYGYSGGSPDWAHGVAGIPYSYTIELRDRGEYGFVLPTSFIRPSGAELYAGVMTVAQYIKNVSGIMETFDDDDIQQAMTSRNDTDTSSNEDMEPPGGDAVNATEPTLPPFVFNESSTNRNLGPSSEKPPDKPTTLDGSDRHNSHNTRTGNGPWAEPPPVLRQETSGGRDDVLCTGVCFQWWKSSIAKNISRIPRFYRWLFETSGRFGPWRGV